MTIFSSIEVNIGLICASAPAIKPLIHKWAPRLLGSTNNSAQLYSPRTDPSYRTDRLTHGRVQEAPVLDKRVNYRSALHQRGSKIMFWTRHATDQRGIGDNESERRVLDVELDSVRAAKSGEVTYDEVS